MTALIQDKQREYELGNINEFKMANGVIYKGAAVGDNGAGFARPLVAGDKFLGFCEQRAMNLVSTEPSGYSENKTARVLRRGLIQLLVTGVITTNIGDNIYASDD